MPETPSTRVAVGRSAGRPAALSDIDLSTPTGGGQVRGRGGPTCRALQQQLHWEREQRQQQQQQDTAGTRRQLQQLQQQFPACRAPPPLTWPPPVGVLRSKSDRAARRPALRPTASRVPGVSGMPTPATQPPAPAMTGSLTWVQCTDGVPLTCEPPARSDWGPTGKATVMHHYCGQSPAPCGCARPERHGSTSYGSGTTALDGPNAPEKCRTTHLTCLQPARWRHAWSNAAGSVQGCTLPAAPDMTNSSSSAGCSVAFRLVCFETNAAGNDSPSPAWILLCPRPPRSGNKCWDDYAVCMQAHAALVA